MLGLASVFLTDAAHWRVPFSSVRIGGLCKRAHLVWDKETLRGIWHVDDTLSAAISLTQTEGIGDIYSPDEPFSTNSDAGCLCDSADDGSGGYRHHNRGP